MESDVIEAPANKKRQKGRQGGKPDPVIQELSQQFEESEKALQGAPGPEFFRRGGGKMPERAPSSTRQRAGAKGSGAGEEKEKEQPKTSEVSETPPAVPEEGVKQAEKWLRLIEAGWYPVRTKDGQKMYLRSPETNSTSGSIPYNEKVFEFWVSKLTDVGKAAMKTTGGSQLETGKSTLVQFVAAKASEELPVVRNLLAKMSWIQNTFYDLGVLTFFKMTKTEGLLLDDTWTITLSDNAAKDEIQAARVKFVESFEKGFDKLLAALPGATEIARLEYELSLESGRLLMTRQSLKTAEANRDYWAQSFKMAQSCMCAPDAKELLSRMMIYGLTAATTKAQESLNAKEAAEETPKHE